jgi:hypothetical protein
MCPNGEAACWNSPDTGQSVRSALRRLVQNDVAAVLWARYYDQIQLRAWQYVNGAPHPEPFPHDDIRIAKTTELIPASELLMHVEQVRHATIAPLADEGGVGVTRKRTAALAKGFRCSLIRPSNLVFYAPIIREVDDYARGVSLTTSGAVVSVNGTSMLDDTIAFALMADRAAPWSASIPMDAKLAYILPYAGYHESRQNWRPLFFAKFFQLVANATSVEEVVARLVAPNVFTQWAEHYWPSSPRQPEPAAGAYHIAKVSDLSQLNWKPYELEKLYVDGRSVRDTCVERDRTRNAVSDTRIQEWIKK